MKRLSSEKQKEVYIANDADVVGDVSIGEKSSIWYHAVVRGDTAPVKIGKETNIQDGCIVHTDPDFPVSIGDRVTIGHRAVIHGCTIGDETLIGMGAIILNGAVIGKNCLIGAGALVSQEMVIPDGALAFGCPAKVRRMLTEEEKKGILHAAEEYLYLSGKHFGI